MHENYGEAAKMIASAEETPGLTVQYLPTFLRVRPATLVDTFKGRQASRLTNLIAANCMKLCRETEGSDCFGKACST